MSVVTPLSAKFSYASRSYICKLYYIAYKNYTLYEAGYITYCDFYACDERIGTKQQLWHFAKKYLTQVV
jgi:hypothetical protein